MSTTSDTTSIPLGYCDERVQALVQALFAAADIPREQPVPGEQGATELFVRPGGGWCDPEDTTLSYAGVTLFIEDGGFTRDYKLVSKKGRAILELRWTPELRSDGSVWATVGVENPNFRFYDESATESPRGAHRS